MQARNVSGVKRTGRSLPVCVPDYHFRTPYKTDHYIETSHPWRLAMSVRINVDKKVEVWEWTCPRGHRDWEPTNFHFWCATCARSHDANPSFDEIENLRTGASLGRGELELVDREGNTIVPPRRVKA